MRNFSILIFIVLFLIPFSSLGQSENMVIIKIQEIQESSQKRFNPKMLIIKPDNSTEIIKLNKFDDNDIVETWSKNGIIIKDEISKWIKKGYEKIKITQQPPTNYVYYTITTIYLIKEE